MQSLSNIHLHTLTHLYTHLSNPYYLTYTHTHTHTHRYGGEGGEIVIHTGELGEIQKRGVGEVRKCYISRIYTHIYAYIVYLNIHIETARIYSETHTHTHSQPAPPPPHTHTHTHTHTGTSLLSPKSTSSGPNGSF
jgi:hypothetical protein